MNNLPDCVLEKVYDYSIGDIDYWKLKFDDVLLEIKLYVNHHHLYCNWVFGKNFKK